MCVALNVKETTKFRFSECSVDLCTGPCFGLYHTKLHSCGGNTTIVITELVLSVALSQRQNGGQQGVNITEGSLRVPRLRRAFI